mmetsp:Transcript_7037/g.13739  ORF Transcript_7037/g.13739 Transcript_7037/m.13739 type:complete len:344 (-) Transcript_7037:103-1134(-)
MSIDGNVLSRLLPLLPFSPALLPTLLPSPSPTAHKGSSLGRFATIGGSPEYFGALGYASRGVLGTGADMCSAFTRTEEAGTALRSFDLTAGDVMCYSGKAAITGGLNDVRFGLTGALVGPGLGRSEESQDWARDAMNYLSPLTNMRSVIVDADGLWPSQSSTPAVLDAFKSPSVDRAVVLTPNAMEYKRLVGSYLAGEEAAPDDADQALRLLAASSATAIVMKGRVDTIVTAEGSRAKCDVPGSTKRPGGLGDVLAGVLCVLVGWSCKRVVEAGQGEGLGPDGGEEGGGLDHAVWTSCWTACAITREASRRAQEKRKRAMTARDVLEEVPGVIEEMSPMENPS